MMILLLQMAKQQDLNLRTTQKNNKIQLLVPLYLHLETSQQHLYIEWHRNNNNNNNTNNNQKTYLLQVQVDENTDQLK